MAHTTIASFDLSQSWPTAYGASGTLGIYCSSNFVDDLGNEYLVGAGDSLTGNFVTKVNISVVGTVGTVAAFSLPKTDLATPQNVPRYSARIFDANGSPRDEWPFQNFHLKSVLGDSISYLYWFNNNQTPIIPPPDGAPTVSQMNVAIAAANPPLGATYITQTSSSILTAEQALSTLNTGLLKNTTTTGVLSIATVGTDYIAGTDYRILKGSYAFSSLPTSNVQAGSFAQVTDRLRGWYRYTGTEWVSVSGQANVRDFSASGSSTTTTTTGTNSSGATTVNVTSNSTYAAGQGILIAGAGAAGVDYIGTVSSVPGSTSIIVTPAISTTVSAGTLVQHDDSAAVQTTINAVHALGGGIAYFPAGTYRFNRALDSTENGVLTLPRVALGGSPVTIRFLGEYVVDTSDSGVVGSGVIWSTTRVTGAGVFPAMFSGRAWADTSSTLANFNYTTPIFENIYFRVNSNPTIGVLQIHNNNNGGPINCKFDTSTTFDAVAEPTNASTAIVMPGVNNNTFVFMEKVSIVGGFTVGVRYSEATEFRHVSVSRCKSAFKPENGFGFNTFSFVEGAHNPKIFDFSDITTQNRMKADHLLFERWDSPPSATAWYQSAGTDWYDPNSKVIGEATFALHQANTGTALRMAMVLSGASTTKVRLINAGIHNETFGDSGQVLGTITNSPQRLMQTADGSGINAEAQVWDTDAWQWFDLTNGYVAGGSTNVVPVNASYPTLGLHINPRTGQFILRHKVAGAAFFSALGGWTSALSTEWVAGNSTWKYSGTGPVDFSAGLKVGTGDTLTKVLKGTVTIDPASINGTTVSSQTFTLTGAVAGDSLVLNPPAAGLTAGLLVQQYFVSAPNVITVVLYNSTGAPIDEGSASWTYTLIRS